MPIGCNVGPNKASVEAGLDAVVRDCTELVRRFASLADYLVINISSPNTAKLRDLQGSEALRALLTEVKSARPANAQKPLFVKIAPDLTDGEIDDVVSVVLQTGIDGIVATNTTIARPDSLQHPNRTKPGGLSGEPLRARSLEVVGRIATRDERDVTDHRGRRNLFRCARPGCDSGWSMAGAGLFWSHLRRSRTGQPDSCRAIRRTGPHRCQIHQ